MTDFASQIFNMGVTMNRMRARDLDAPAYLHLVGTQPIAIAPRDPDDPLAQDRTNGLTYAMRCSVVLPILTLALSYARRLGPYDAPTTPALPDVVADMAKQAKGLLSTLDRDDRIEAQRVAETALGLMDVARSAIARHRAATAVSNALAEPDPRVIPEDDGDWEGYTNKVTNAALYAYRMALTDPRR